MVYSLQRVVVGNYGEWKATVEEEHDLRAEHGLQGGPIFKSPANENEVIVFFKWDSEAEARKFMEETITARRWERAHILV